MHSTTCGKGLIVAGETETLLLPRGGGAGRRVVLAFHGAGGTPAGYQVGGTGLFRHLHALADAGFIVLVPEFGGAQTWVSDVVLTRFDSYRTALAAMFPTAVHDKALLWAGSMGNGNALRCALDRPGQVAAIAANIPLCDVQQIHVSNGFGARAGIDAAWGIAYPAPVPARGDILARAQAGELAGLPWKGWNGTADTVCPPSTVDALVAAIGATASRVVVDTTNEHSDAIISAAPTADIVDFLAIYRR